MNDGNPRGEAAPDPYLVKAPEAARLLGVGLRFLWSKTKSGEIKSVRLSSRAIRYRPEDLRAFIEERLKRKRPRESVPGGGSASTQRPSSDSDATDPIKATEPRP